MENSIAVDEEEGIEELRHDGLDLREREFHFLAAKQSCKVMLAKFTNKVNAFFVSAVRRVCRFNSRCKDVNNNSNGYNELCCA